MAMLNNQMVTFNMMQLDWIWGKYGCAVVAADGCIYAPPYNARQAWGKSYCVAACKAWLDMDMKFQPAAHMMLQSTWIVAA